VILRNNGTVAHGSSATFATEALSFDDVASQQS
jgi:hypothetical protein